MRCYQIETLEDTQQDSKEEIEAIIGDELVCLPQENKRLRLMQEQMTRRKVVMKRAQIMQQQIVQERATQSDMEQAIEDLRLQEQEPLTHQPSSH
jgi:hypothetical protein